MFSRRSPEKKKLPVCVVVGLGNKGIGDHCAKKWAKEGYAVAMLARRRENLEALEKEIPESRGYKCDATCPEAVTETMDNIERDMGPVEVCIYNAGLGYFKPFEETSFEDFENSWRAGPAGLFCFAKAVIPKMAGRGAGTFGVTGATASWRGVKSTPAFASAKFGLLPGRSRNDAFKTERARF